MRQGGNIKYNRQEEYKVRKCKAIHRTASPYWPSNVSDVSVRVEASRPLRSFRRVRKPYADAGQNVLLWRRSTQLLAR